MFMISSAYISHLGSDVSVYWGILARSIFESLVLHDKYSTDYTADMLVAMGNIGMLLLRTGPNFIVW